MKARAIVLASLTCMSCGQGSIDAIALAPGHLSVGLVAHWSFDEGSGTVVHDSSGNQHDGNLNGTTWSWLAEGKWAGGLGLQQGDYVEIDNFPNATPSWTVANWIKFASKDIGIGDATILSTEDVFKGGWEMVLTALATDLHYHFGFWTGPGSYDYTHYECLGCVHPDQWQHLAAVVDSDEATLAFYLDGALQARVSIPKDISPGVSTLYMGRWATTDPPRLLVGSLDDVAIWSRPLVSAEITELCTGPAP